MDFEQKFKKINLLFGNHAQPEVLNETFEIIKKSNFFSRDSIFNLKRYPEDNCINLVIEEMCFSENFNSKINETKNSQNIIFLTEFVTGDTLNAFNFVDKLKSIMCNLVIKNSKTYSYPKTYWEKNRISKMIGNYNFYMKMRYLKLLENIKNYDVLITYYDQQRKDYQKIFKKENFFILKYGSNFNPEQFNLSQKKIDFFYSGAITPYRNKILTNLKLNRFKIFIGRFMNEAQKNRIQSNSKFTLIIPQNKNWKYTSVAKTISALENNSIPIIQENLIMHDLERENFVEKVKKWNDIQFFKNVINKYND